MISGRGSNMIALADACDRPDYPARIVGVISDRADAGGIALARARGIATCALPRSDQPDKRAHEMAIDAQLRAWDTRVVCLAGFMRLLSAEVLAPWRGRIINIHPSLLPRHKGLDTHARALEAGVKLHGCTVHVVRPDMDAGPIIAQSAVPVLDGDDPDTLAERVLAAEHALYPHALSHVARSLATGDWAITDERVTGVPALGT